MKILYLTARVPHSAVAGGEALVYQRITRLARRGHEVSLLSLQGPGEDVPDDDPLRDSLKEFRMVPRSPPAAHPLRLLRSGCSAIPPYFWAYHSPVMMRMVGDMVHESGHDLVVAEFSTMGQYLHHNPYLPAVRKIISCHFSVAATSRITGLRGPGLRSRISDARLLKYEVGMFRGVDRVLVLTAHERYQLLHADPMLAIKVVPCGVDTDLFRPDPAVPREEALIFTGQYAVPSNVDAVEWFCSNCWPIIKRRRPGMKFYVVGPNPPENFRRLSATDPSIVVTGRVEDVRPWLHRAMLYVCPVRLGSGLRFKLFEVMASGLPLVTTTLGGGGIPLQNGDNCFMADTPEIMAECIHLLLEDEVLRNDIARKARELVVSRFQWDHSIDLLEKVMEDTFAH